MNVNIGGYAHTIYERVAGAWGCDACFFCDDHPKYGDRIYVTNYGDIICALCADAHKGERS